MMGAFLALGLLGCEHMSAEPIAVFADLGAPIETLGDGTEMFDDADLITSTDAGLVPVDPIACVGDDDCPGQAWCGPESVCVDPPDTHLVRPVFDGMTRAGAASFELVPSQLESWHDRAGPECPGNRMGLFDGQLNDPKPTGPCRDGFDDLDGDGVFDAVWLGGPGQDRPAHAVDETNPPLGRVVVLTRDDAVVVLLSFDLYGFDRGGIERLTSQLSQRLGLPSEAFIIHASGNRSAPDAIGLSGPSWARTARGEMAEGLSSMAFMDLPIQSGLDERWWRALVRRTSVAVRRAAEMRLPVQVRSATAELPVRMGRVSLGSDELGESETDGPVEVQPTVGAVQSWRTEAQPLVRELNLPGTVDGSIRLVSLDHMEDQTPSILLVGWSGAPALRSTGNRLSADYPGLVRQSLESRFPGATAVWLTGAAADTHVVDETVLIPQVDEQGRMIGLDGQPTDNPLDAAPSLRRGADLATLISGRLTTQLEQADSRPAELHHASRSVWIPVENPRLGLAAWLGILSRHRDWLSGQRPTSAWISGEFAPSCGGLGCVRYRLDRLQLSDRIALTTAPGALDQGYITGRNALTVRYADARNYEDLDGDGRSDHDDGDGIIVATHIGRAAGTYEVEHPVNPQNFERIRGLGSDSNWIIGRTNGGWGSLRSATERVNVFEGQMESLLAISERPELSDLKLSDLGFPVRGDLTVALLAERLMESSPHVLADLTTSHELRCGGEMPLADGPQRWALRDVDGTLLAEADDLILTDDGRVFSASVDFGALDLANGAELYLPEHRDAPWPVHGINPIVLRHHPNAGDAWESTAAAGGDHVYNALCDLLGEGECVDPRPLRRDPNRQLPRMRRSSP